LKAELRAAGVTCANLADVLGMPESSVKRVFGKADMPPSRIDGMLRVLKMDFAELASGVADARSPRSGVDAVDQEVRARILAKHVDQIGQRRRERRVQRVRRVEHEDAAAGKAEAARVRLLEREPRV
jgi:hypothetical protein